MADCVVVVDCEVDVSCLGELGCLGEAGDELRLKAGSEGGVLTGLEVAEGDLGREESRWIAVIPDFGDTGFCDGRGVRKGEAGVMGSKSSFLEDFRAYLPLDSFVERTFIETARDSISEKSFPDSRSSPSSSSFRTSAGFSGISRAVSPVVCAGAASRECTWNIGSS